MEPFSIFDISTEAEFNRLALETFHFQYSSNAIYQKYISLLKINPNQIKTVEEIPFLPIEFFKTHKVITQQELKNKKQVTFISSGTTGTETSKHHVGDVSIY